MINENFSRTMINYINGHYNFQCRVFTWQLRFGHRCESKEMKILEFSSFNYRVVRFIRFKCTLRILTREQHWLRPHRILSTEALKNGKVNVVNSTQCNQTIHTKFRHFYTKRCLNDVLYEVDANSSKQPLICIPRCSTLLFCTMRHPREYSGSRFFFPKARDIFRGEFIFCKKKKKKSKPLSFCDIKKKYW